MIYLENQCVIQIIADGRHNNANVTVGSAPTLAAEFNSPLTWLALLAQNY